MTARDKPHPLRVRVLHNRPRVRLQAQAVITSYSIHYTKLYDVKLRIEGEDIELDRAILDELSDPLVHMVRNAVDHGIDKRGVVTVRAWREKDMVLLSVADDGWGMDPEKIRSKAVEKGLISPTQARSMRDRDALQLVCVPGFSTAAKITETSGRGVGMDVVKNAVETLGGMLQIRNNFV